jgi:bifunctional DNA-binding transcriptional regulator/antitoxin component of YhaV-PrlF toxin-antitoxin module
MVIPKEFAKRHGLDKPGHVTVEESPDGQGLLVKPLKIV